MDLLVELDADLNVADHDGRTAVSWAASNGHADIVRKLLSSGARPAIYDKEGLTPLMRAAWNGHEDVWMQGPRSRPRTMLGNRPSITPSRVGTGKSPGFCGRLERKPLPQFDLMRE